MVATCLEALARAASADGAFIVHRRTVKSISRWSTTAIWVADESSWLQDYFEHADWNSLIDCIGDTWNLTWSPDREVERKITAWVAPFPNETENNRYLGFVRVGELKPAIDHGSLVASARALAETECENTEFREMRETNVRLQTAIDTAGLSVWKFSWGSRTVEVGQRFWSLLGHGENVSKVSDEAFLSFAYPDDVATLQGELDRLVLNPTASIDLVVRFITASGSLRWMRVKGKYQPSLIDVEHGLVVGTIQDVHDQVNLDALIVNTLEDLADARIRASEAARTIQEELLVKAPPKRIGNFQIASCSFPSQVADGDFLDVLPIGETIVDLVAGDVMGKGITAALVGAGIKAQIARTFGLLAAGRTVPSPAKVMQAVHDRVGPQLAKLGSFATLAYARIDSEERTLELVDCGHPRILIVSPDSGIHQFVSGDNLPLGILRGEVYRASIYPLEPGDMVIMYSDGLLDVELEGQALGEEGLLLLVLEACQRPSPVDALIQAFHDLRKDHQLRDDLTCLVVRLGGRYSRTFSKVVLPSELSEIDRLRSFISNGFAELNPQLNVNDIAAFELAGVESFTNVVRYAHVGRVDEEVQVEVAREKGHHELRLRYRGEPFEPTVVPLPESPDLEKESGWGLGIIHEIADSVEYEQDDRGTVCVTISRNVPDHSRVGHLERPDFLLH